MARQYFNATLGDSLLVAQTITPLVAETTLLTAALTSIYFPIGVGANAPSAGQVFRFALGGILTTPATGTLIITPRMGLTTAGTSLGASAAQTTTASLASQPWRMEGELTFRSISPAATASTCWLTGQFQSQGTLATAGGGWSQIFGSTAAVTVDTSGAGTGNTFGGLSFSVTFSVTGATVITEYTSFQSLN